jgi:RNase P/RNase MRP subunit p29
LLGASVEVLGSKIAGELVYESKNMLVLRGSGGLKKVPKAGNIFVIDGQTKIDGRTLVGRPVERMMKG